MVSQVSEQQAAGRRHRNRRGEGGRLREELIEAARRLLAAAERESDVSIRAVTREAGAAPQSFYLQFPSLDELLYAVYAVEYGELHQAMARAASRARDPRTRLAAVCTAYCRYAQEQPARYRALTGVRGQPGHQEWDGRPLPGAPAFTLLRDTVAQALAAEGSPADPFLAAVTLWAALHGMVTLRASRPAFPWPPLADMIAAATGQALSAPTPAAGTPQSAPGQPGPSSASTAAGTPHTPGPPDR
jgi:AcrR family transcriptional regulator